MSRSEFLTTHNRDHPWITADGRKIKLRDMKTGHIEAVVQHLELKLRKSAGYAPTHPRRKYEGRAQFHLSLMKAELEWRDRNGLT